MCGVGHMIEQFLLPLMVASHAPLARLLVKTMLAVSYFDKVSVWELNCKIKGVRSKGPRKDDWDQGSQDQGQGYQDQGRELAHTGGSAIKCIE